MKIIQLLLKYFLSTEEGQNFKPILELLQKNVAQYHLEDQVTLTGSFCTGKCNRVGVTVQVDDDIHTGITKENFNDFFKEKVLNKLERK